MFRDELIKITNESAVDTIDFKFDAEYKELKKHMMDCASKCKRVCIITMDTPILNKILQNSELRSEMMDRLNADDLTNHLYCGSNVIHQAGSTFSIRW